MSDFSLRQLQFFVAVVEEGSVTEAASRLRVSPGGVSVAMSQLEATLKVQLILRRRGKGAAVTPAGKWVYDQARKVLEGAEGITSVAAVVRGELAGPLRIGCFSTLSPWLFPRIAAHFAAEHPGIDVQLIEGASAELQARLKAGELDVALLYANHMAGGVTGTEIVPVRLQLALAPGHRLAAREEIWLRELENEEAILLGVQPSMGHVEDILRRAGLRPNVRWRSTNVETIRSMVARGLGYTIIMGRPYGDYTYDGLPLVYRRIADDIPENAVVVAYPEGTTPTAKVRTLIAFCRSEFGAEGQQPDAGRWTSREGMGEL
ncbi:LysR family transcriptional regulator [Arthrobacter sulfonylureivorans]|uniref:LysR family transcriptional regulator n=1 Tax=Arthrobacter sulfonylureivorans TaxID=2486855 RepID=UPI0039E5D0C8